jgi:hypothetical protein
MTLLLNDPIVLTFLIVDRRTDHNTTKVNPNQYTDDAKVSIESWLTI